MVNFKGNIMKGRFALVSVYEKNKIEKLCKIFNKYNISIIATDSTSKYIKKIGFKCFKLNEFTNFKEILNGRVKTLHPKLYASILFIRKKKKHRLEFKSLNFPKIDFVICNLYPFGKIIKNKKINNSTELIDIGGPSLLRSAGKNYESVTTICNISDYESFINNLNENKGKTSISFRKKMAAKVFNLTSNYDNSIFNWLNNSNTNTEMFQNHLMKYLRYGENPHQEAFYLKEINTFGIDDAVVYATKELSYNNILDISSALNCIDEFKDPTCVIIKHNSPCGAASNKKIILAYKNALLTDPLSAFGGIVISNKKVDKKLALLISNNFFEIIIATSFTKEAHNILIKKKNIILIKSNTLNDKQKFDLRSIQSGYLLQKKNKTKFSKNLLNHVSKIKASKKSIDDLVFAFKICKHVKSNSLVLAKNMTVLSIGSGQTSRLDSTKISLRKINRDQKKKGFVAASDAFFPFVDNIKLLIKNNCKAIVQPSGSINDKKIIDFAKKNKMPLYFSPYRFFKH